MNHNIFGYWSDINLSPISKMMQEWAAYFANFQILSDDDIVPLINKHLPSYLSTYNAIRIPAAKSDIARLVALYELGGLYVDCHVGIKDVLSLKILLAKLVKVDAIFIDRRLDFGLRPPGEHFLINSIIAGRANLPIFLHTAEIACANLEQHRSFEKKRGFTPYHVGHLSGPEVLTAAVLQPDTQNREVRRNLADRILIIPEESLPIERNRHRQYSVPSAHWSERQKNELLFSDLI